MALYLNGQNSLYSRSQCAKFGQNWPYGAGEEIFLKNRQVCLLFRYYLSFENVKALHFFKFGSPLLTK